MTPRKKLELAFREKIRRPGRKHLAGKTAARPALAACTSRQPAMPSCGHRFRAAAHHADCGDGVNIDAAKKRATGPDWGLIDGGCEAS
jgi:hypothetical protein